MPWDSTESILEIKNRAKILHRMLLTQGGIVRGNADQLSWLPTLANDNVQISRDIDKIIDLLETEKNNAVTSAQKAEYARKVQALAAGLTKITDGVIASIRGIQSGDPYATSAAILDLCGSLISTIGAVAGPHAAAAGALMGSLLSVVSTILKQFIPQPPPLTKQIEEIIRKIGSEQQQERLKAAQTTIMAFMNIARNTKEEWTFNQCVALLNPVDGNAMTGMRLADEWLQQPNNQHLPLWGEILELRLRNLTILKVALSLWVPVIKAADRNKVVDAFSGGDDEDLEFVKKIKPAARSRGTIWHAGVPQALYASETPAEGYKPFGEAGTVRAMAVSRQNGQAVSRPHLSLFVSEPREAEVDAPGFDHSYHLYDKPSSPSRSSNPQYHKALHRFRQNGRTKMCCGQWPLDDRQWQMLPELEGCYDVWALPGDSMGAVSVYAATGQTIRHYTHAAKHVRGQELQLIWQSEPVAGYKVGAVRVAKRPRTSSGDDPALLEKVDWVAYGLCEVSEKKSVVAGGPLRDVDHFEIQAFYSDSVKGSVLPPWDAEWQKKGIWYPWANVAGIATDSEYLWVFRAGEIACAAHSNVRNSAKTTGDVNWIIYTMPSTLGNYDPTKRIFHGLQDLSPCDDGTLTAVFHESSKAYGTGSTDGSRRICTSTPRFESGPNGKKLIIEGWKPGQHVNQPIRTDGWSMDKSTEASRVFKQPIFCWPLIEKLEADLSAPAPKPTEQVAAASEGPAEFSRSRIGLGDYIDEQSVLLRQQLRPDSLAT